MEDFYREIYAVDGITGIKFPDHYPVSRLLGKHSYAFVFSPSYCILVLYRTRLL